MFVLISFRIISNAQNILGQAYSETKTTTLDIDGFFNQACTYLEGTEWKDMVSDLDSRHP